MNTILAIALLFDPVGVSMQEALNEPECQAIRKVCIAQEWVDPREEQYILRGDTIEQQQPDIDVLRSRVKTLWDAPRVAESSIYPPRTYINECCAVNAGYERHLEMMLVMDADKTPQILEAISERDLLWRVYDRVRDAQCEYYYITTRREALMDLKRLLGEEYGRGTLPPHVPIWRFHE